MFLVVCQRKWVRKVQYTFYAAALASSKSSCFRRAASTAWEALDTYFVSLWQESLSSENFNLLFAFSDLTPMYDMSVRKQNYTNSGKPCSCLVTC